MTNRARFVGTLLIASVAGILVMPAADAQAPRQSSGSNQGTKPTPKVYSCGGQLTRPADEIITMEAGKAFYKSTVNDTPVTTPPTGDLGSVTAAEAKLLNCTRRVIEIRVPSTTTSGCADCYPNAEINVCAGSFSGSKEWEEHCRVPVSSTPLADCKTFTHQVQVYKKAAGSKSFNLTPLRNFNYKGFVDGTGCRVGGQYLGQIHDTAEAYANVTPPGSGMDVYRVLSLPKYKGALLDTVVFIEFDKRRR